MITTRGHYFCLCIDIVILSLDDDTLYSDWSDSVMTSMTCVVCLF